MPEIEIEHVRSAKDTIQPLQLTSAGKIHGPKRLTFPVSPPPLP
jgi:hypothetical protein